MSESSDEKTSIREGSAGSPSRPASTKVIDVDVAGAPVASPSVLGTFTGWKALAVSQNGFAAALAPLTRNSFQKVIHEVQDRLRIVSQTLGMLHENLDVVLGELLLAIQSKLAELLYVDRVTVFLVDEERDELWTQVSAFGQTAKSIEIRIGFDAESIVSEVAREKKVTHIPFDLFDDPRSGEAKRQFQRTGYRSYNMLALPLLDDRGRLLAVVQLMNKVSTLNSSLPLEQRIDREGFTPADEALFGQFIPCMRLILESSRSFYKTTQKQSAAEALMRAALSMGQSLDLDTTLGRVMDEAKQLMSADRSTLWLLDRDRNDLWTRIRLPDGKLREMRVPLGSGFAGQVGLSGETLNIPFDLYEHPQSQMSRQVDQQNNYRTCSLLCMPVFNSRQELIAVTQLVNKRRRGEHAEYDPADWPKAPECFHASFTKQDEDFMRVFNIQAGVALENAMLFAKVREEQRMQEDILRSLSDAVISLDKNGDVLASNGRALDLLCGPDSERKLEGRSVFDLVRTESDSFRRWIQASVSSSDAKTAKQFYPEQTIVAAGGERTVNISVNRMLEVEDSSKIRGALVVIEDVSQEKRLKSTLYRYMTQEVAEQLMEAGDAQMGGQRKEVSVLFSDIRSYTTLTEKMQAEEVVTFLNEYFDTMVEAVFHYKGTLDKFIGDAIMAIYGAPLEITDHAWMAVQTALDMRRRLTEFNAERKGHPIRIGIGINSDVVISGNIGSPRRMEFTAIGDGVNLCSRLESASKAYGCDILISHSTYQHCGSKIRTRELDYVRVKGKNQPIGIHELIGLSSDPLPPNKEQLIERYSIARELFTARRFSEAARQFEAALNVDPKDASSALFIERCRHFQENPPDADWDGSWTMLEK